MVIRTQIFLVSVWSFIIDVTILNAITKGNTVFLAPIGTSFGAEDGGLGSGVEVGGWEVVKCSLTE